MSLWDPIRCLYVEETPEEAVRQEWILTMIHSLGYPKSLIVVEKGLASLPHRQMSFDPNRRLDLLCYTPGKDGLIPLLLIEIKAEKTGVDAESQLLGYNESVRAFFLCVIEGKEAKTFWREKGRMNSVPFLPPYSQLALQVSSNGS